jgi:hypothetical protein
MVTKKVVKKVAKKKSPPKDKVVFRVFKDDGGVIALFPEHDEGRGKVSSYMQLGQHSGADYSGVVSITRKATPQEYSDIKKELTSIGYNLDIKEKYIRGYKRS